MFHFNIFYTDPIWVYTLTIRQQFHEGPKTLKKILVDLTIVVWI